jgi:hypothetical protein
MTSSKASKVVSLPRPAPSQTPPTTRVAVTANYVSFGESPEDAGDCEAGNRGRDIAAEACYGLLLMDGRPVTGVGDRH